MKLLYPSSLSKTVDAVAEAVYFNTNIPEAEKVRTAGWIAERQGAPGAYAGMFAPTTNDFKNGIRLFTGERITTGAATGHILGEESCRALLLLDVKDPHVAKALKAAIHNMDERLIASDKDYPHAGFF